MTYTDDSDWRNGTELLRGRTAIVAFVTRKGQRELDYRAKKTLWAFGTHRIAVRFEHEWHDHRGPVVPLVRQRDVGVRRERPDEEA